MIASGARSSWTALRSPSVQMRRNHWCRMVSFICRLYSRRTAVTSAKALQQSVLQLREVGGADKVELYFQSSVGAKYSGNLLARHFGACQHHGTLTHLKGQHLPLPYYRARPG